MNTPTPTPRTDAATYPADCLGKTLVTNRDCARTLERELASEREKVRVLCKALQSIKNTICRDVPDGYSQPCVDESADECDKIIDAAMKEGAK